jgi:peptide/nickel transport system permease protein
MTGVVIISVVITLGLLAPVLGGDPRRVDPANRLRPPSAEYFLGTDEMGRDLWTVLLYGAQTSIGIAGTCTVLAIVIGYLTGVLSGYFPAVDAVMMRIMDGLMSFPNIILVMALIGVVGNGIPAVVFGLTVVLVPPMARVVRSATLSARELPMVESAVSLGAKTRWILTKYVAPEAISVVIVQATMAFSMTVLSIAALSFLGIGLPPDVPSWGSSLSSAQQYFNVAWWIGVFPGLAILVTVLGLILLGDGLRDIFDPRSTTVRAAVA